MRVHKSVPVVGVLATGVVLTAVTMSTSFAATNESPPNAAAPNSTPTTLVSVDSTGKAAGSTGGPTTSADGRHVTFLSSAALIAADRNTATDVYLRDTTTGSSALVNVSDTGVQADKGYALLDGIPAISGDGRFVAFATSATNLVAGDTNATTDVFVRDTVAGTTTRASVATAGAQAAGNSNTPSISADGNLVTFWSAASNLVAGDTNNKVDLFARDLRTGTTTRVNVATSGAQADQSPLAVFSRGPASIGDHHIAFASTATTLVDGDTNAAEDVFVRDLVAGTTTRVSVTTAGVQGDGDSFHPSISADGARVAFVTNAPNLRKSQSMPDQWEIVLHDATAGTTGFVSLGAAADAVGTVGINQSKFDVLVSISANGRYLAFTSTSNPFKKNGQWLFGSFVRSILVRDLEKAPAGLLTDTDQVISVSPTGAKPDAASSAPWISGDGSRVAFSSKATNLVEGDANAKTDIFVHELAG